MCCSVNLIDNLRAAIKSGHGPSFVCHTAVYSGTLIWHLAQIGLNLRFNFINRAQCRTLLTVLWQQQHFKMSTKYECDKGSRKNGRNPFATSHDCHFMHISSFTQTLRNRVGTVGMPNTNFNWGVVYLNVCNKINKNTNF